MQKSAQELTPVRQRGRRAHQQQGYYSALLKGKTISPKVESSAQRQEQSASRKTEPKPARKRQPAKHKTESTDPSVQQQPSTEATAANQDDQMSVANVVAVVEDDTVSSSNMKGFLSGDSLPWQQSPVKMQQSEGQLTIQGTIEQVHHVLQQLAKMKSKTEGTHTSNKEFVRVEPSDPSVCVQSLDKEAGRNAVHNVKTVYVKSGSGAELPVKVEVPLSSSNLSVVAAGNPSTISIATESGEVVETVAETVIYSDNTENFTDLDQQFADNSANISHRTAEANSLLGNRVSSQTSFDKTLTKSTPTEIFDQLSSKALVVHHAPLPENRDAGSHNEAHNSKRNNSALVLPSSMPGLLPLDSVFRCGLCGEECGNEKLVKLHMEVVHASREEAINCEVCSLVFPDKRRLLLHLKAKHEAANLTCQICGKQFQCQRYLRTHLQRHAGVKKFECLQCGWRFFERHKLKFHMELHKEESERSLPYRCALCGKQFANKATWSDHCNTHSGLRPFECDVCGAKFGHRVGLRRHKLTHEKVKPFSCNRCSKTFTLKPKLDEHMITHTGVSKHTCVICEKVFTAATSLKRHTLKCAAASALHAQAETSTTPDTATEAHLSAVALEALESQDSEQAVFLCGACNACFMTYEEAEEHTLTHQVSEDQGRDVMQEMSSQDVAVLAVPSGSGEEPSDERERQITVSVEELEQIQLAASTLADLSTM